MIGEESETSSWNSNGDIMYRICGRCVMDTNDPTIRFDAHGVCNHCHNYDHLVKGGVFTGADGARRIKRIVEKIQERNKNREYDCVVGLSGGADSSYTACLIADLGLQPLAVTMDNGWNTTTSNENIDRLVRHLHWPLNTIKLDWDEFSDLQRSFLYASTPDIEIPTDHALMSSLYRLVWEFDLNYLVTGENVRTETHIPEAWSTGHSDWKYIKSVHEQFGTVPLRSYPHRSRLQDIWYRETTKVFRILDYVDYVKDDAVKYMRERFGFIPYGPKHHESAYTRFVQCFILPKKFGYDKRRGHLSSLICSGQLTREEARAELTISPYPYPFDQEEWDWHVVLGKLRLSDGEFDRIMRLPKKTILDYPSYARTDRRVPLRWMKNGYRTYRHLAKRFL